LGLTDSSITANVRYQHYRYYILEHTGGGSGTPDIFAGDAAVSAVFNSLEPSSVYEQDQTMNYLTGSIQAVVKVANPVTLVGGISTSNPKIEYQTYSGPFQNLDPGNQLSYRGAAIYEPVNGTNLYASYSQSFQPNLRIDTSYNVLPPVSGRQFELGAKMSPSKSLLLTAALFDIHETNVAEYAATNSAGEALYAPQDVRHRGLELEATGQLAKRWQIKGGISLLNAIVTTDPGNPVNDGETRPWLPKSSANVYTSYALSNGITVSGGGRYVGSVKTYDNASSAPMPDLPAYTVLDAGASYLIDRWLLQLNLKNFLNKQYSVPTPVFGSLAAGLYPGEPRSIALSVRRDF
jgi:iron complex outermembrane receptor protein